MCINFTNLSTACLKDSYSLPLADHLVNKSSGTQLLCFMDAHIGYNYI